MEVKCFIDLFPARPLSLLCTVELWSSQQINDSSRLWLRSEAVSSLLLCSVASQIYPVQTPC